MQYIDLDRIKAFHPVSHYIEFHIGDSDSPKVLLTTENSRLETDSDEEEKLKADQAISIVKAIAETGSHNNSPENSLILLQSQKLSLIEQVNSGFHIKRCISSKKQNFQKGVNDTHSETRGVALLLKTNYQKTADGHFEMINIPLLKKQKQVLGYLIKQFGSAILSGKSIMSLSLPVTVFEPRSLLERTVNSFMHAPSILTRGIGVTDALKQFKIAVTFLITTLYCDLNPEKPFNPILGETFQGILGGHPVYSEQVSHHPPVCAFQMYGDNYTIDGLREFNAAISANSVRSKYYGFPKITFKNTKNMIRYQAPNGLMTGTAFGKRLFVFDGRFYIFDLENRFYCEIEFNLSDSFFSKNKKTKDYFRGKIWKVNQKFIEKLNKKMKKGEIEKKFDEKKYAVETLDEIEGYWKDYLQIGNEVTWRYGENWPHILKYFDNPLPSDSNYRLDIIHMKNGSEAKAQEAKTLIEEVQRRDGKLRLQYSSKSKK